MINAAALFALALAPLYEDATLVVQTNTQVRDPETGSFVPAPPAEYPVRIQFDEPTEAMKADAMREGYSTDFLVIRVLCEGAAMAPTPDSVFVTSRGDFMVLPSVAVDSMLIYWEMRCRRKSV